MYAIVQLGASQFKVSEGDLIDVQRLSGDVKKSITFDKVLIFAKGSDVRIGQPFLKDVKVSAKIVSHISDKRVITLKYRKRKNSASKIGYRPKLTVLNITKISV